MVRESPIFRSLQSPHDVVVRRVYLHITSLTHATDALHGIRSRYRRDATTFKVSLLERALSTPPRSLRGIVRLHDDLLFLRAFPDNGDVARLARLGLGQTGRWARRAMGQGALDDSGIASSTSSHTFPYSIARWLVAKFPAEIGLDWHEITDTSHLDALLRTFLTRAEEDAFDAGELSTRQWMKLAVPSRMPSDLAWLITNGKARPRFDALYDAAPLPIFWRLGGSSGATTRNELAGLQPVYRRGLRAAPRAPKRHIASPLPSIELLPASRAGEVIDLARAALTARCREVFAISNPNADEVWLADLGEGTALAIIGTEPSLRMSLEANYGYVLMSNGIPIGYGGVTPLWMQANTGINIFDPFRGSEAAFLWSQMLRAFHTLFGVRRFVVNGYQFGEGNREAIASGAFWFYYRMGFRPVDHSARQLAAREAVQLRRDRDYRSPPDVLKALARGDLHLTLSGDRPVQFIDERLLQTCAIRVTLGLAVDSYATRAAAQAACEDRVRAALNVRSLNRWPRTEREAFRRMAPTLDLIPSLSRWSSGDKTALVALARSKGATRERDFVLQAQMHRRFWPELRRVLLRARAH